MLKILLVVILIAVTVYLVTRAVQRHAFDQTPQRQLPRLPRPKPQPPRVLGPDDDPDFLRDLERKRRHPEDPEA